MTDDDQSQLERLATLCVYAMWRLAPTDREIECIIDKLPIADLWVWSGAIAGRTDTSKAACKVYAEAIAMRIEGK